jgi:hypothetical protein
MKAKSTQQKKRDFLGSRFFIANNFDLANKTHHFSYSADKYQQDK